MPAVSTITLANGEATPVNHSFAPLGRHPVTGFWWYEDQSPRVSSSSSLGWPRIGIRVRRASDAGPGDDASSRVNRVELVISLPQLETVATSDSGLTPPPTVAYVDRAKIEFLLPSRNTLADRSDALAYAHNLLNNNDVTDVVTSLKSLY